jgi:hypothetical protein
MNKSILYLAWIALGIGILPFTGRAEIAGQWEKPISMYIPDQSIEDMAASNGTLYAALLEEQNGDRRVSVKKFGKLGWEFVGQRRFSAPAKLLSLYVDNGTPYVAFSDLSNQVAIPGYGWCGQVTVMKYFEPLRRWVAVGPPCFTSDYVCDVDLFVYAGTPYVAYGDLNAVGVEKVTTVKFDAARGWQAVGNPRFSWWEVGSPISLYVDGGTPYVAYDEKVCDGEDDCLMHVVVMTYDSAIGAWDQVDETGEMTTTGNKNPRIYVDRGTPYIAFGDAANGCVTTVLRYDAQDGWVTVGADGMPSPESGENFAMSLSAAEGIPVVGYDNALGDRHRGNVKAYMGEALEWVGQQNHFPDDGPRWPRGLMCEDTRYIYAAYPEFEEANVGWNFLGMIIERFEKPAPDINVRWGDDDILSAGSISWQGVYVNYTSRATFTLDNLGGFKALNISSIELSGPSAALFHVLPPADLRLKAGESAPFQLEIKPDSVGWKKATLLLRSNDPDEPVYAITVNAKAVMPPDIDVAQGARGLASGTGTYSFGALYCGAPRPTAEFTIRNSGGAILRINDLTIREDRPEARGNNFWITRQSGWLVNPGESTTFSVTFAPVSIGSKRAVVTITSNDPDETRYTFAVTGTGLALQASP